MVAILLIIAASAATLPAPKPADIAWIAEGEFCEPETVLPLPDDTLLVSNVCDFRQSGNGFLSLLAGDGKVLDWHVVDGMDAPLGMALGDDRLYVVDTNRIVIFRWPGFERLETIDLDTTVANDVAAASDGTIYVTDTAEHKVIRRLDDGSLATLQGRFEGANGIELRDDKLYVGGKHLWRVDLDDGSVETIGPDWLSDIDGIEFEADGTLQVTPVAGPLVRYWNDENFEVLGGNGVSSANHGFAPRLGLALIPTGFDNQVIAIRIVDY